jgi:hypothetical protein
MDISQATPISSMKPLKFQWIRGSKLNWIDLNWIAALVFSKSFMYSIHLWYIQQTLVLSVECSRKTLLSISSSSPCSQCLLSGDGWPIDWFDANDSQDIATSPSCQYLKYSRDGNQILVIIGSKYHRHGRWFFKLTKAGRSSRSVPLEATLLVVNWLA